MTMMDSFIGLEDYRIQFTTNEGDYEGTISRIAPAIELLMIRNLIWLPKNSKMGTLAFRAYEIKDFKIIGRSESPKPDFSSNTRIYHQDSQRYTLADDELCDNITDSESETFAEMYPEEEQEYELKLPPNLFSVLPSDHVIVDCFKEEFPSAIKYIKQQDVIGLTLESPKIDRHEKLHWLCISTESCTFLFDIQELGKSAFTNGLKSVLEEASIIKVTHDCREMSDCLYHQFNTRLVNVFDTQVADFIINMQRKKGQIDHHVRSLNFCLVQYLNVPDEFLYCHKQRSYQDELVYFGLRPLIEDFKDLFIKNVIYLRRLKQELDCFLVEPLNKGIDIYLHALQIKTDREFQLEQFNPTVLPMEFLISRIKIFRFKKYVEIPAIVSSGPPYRRIESRFNAYFDYCKRYNIGEKNINKNNDENLKCADIKRLDSDVISHNDGDSTTCVDNTKICGDLSEKNSSGIDLENEDPWSRLRKAFASVGPLNDERKIKFIPAGMEL